MKRRWQRPLCPGQKRMGVPTFHPFHYVSAKPPYLFCVKYWNDPRWRASDARRLGLKLEACPASPRPGVEPRSPRRECSLQRHLFGLTQREFAAYCIGNQNHAVMGLKSAKMTREELP